MQGKTPHLQDIGGSGQVLAAHVAGPVQGTHDAHNDGVGLQVRGALYVREGLGAEIQTQQPAGGTHRGVVPHLGHVGRQLTAERSRHCGFCGSGVSQRGVQVRGRGKWSAGALHVL